MFTCNTMSALLSCLCVTGGTLIGEDELIVMAGIEHMVSIYLIPRHSSRYEPSSPQQPPVVCVHACVCAYINPYPVYGGTWPLAADPSAGLSRWCRYQHQTDYQH